jgi:hypothetical protein
MAKNPGSMEVINGLKNLSRVLAGQFDKMTLKERFNTKLADWTS